MSDVLAAAFTAAQPPAPPAGSADRGDCARCPASDAPLIPTRLVVSKVFTAFDGWRDPTGHGVCAACAWAYQTRSLRRWPYLVTTKPGLRQLTPADLGRLLQQPLPAEVACIVPLRPGRKHLLPTAHWGRVTVDDASLTWTSADAARLAALRRLRRLGFGPRQLAEPAPAWGVLRRLPPKQRREVHHEWAVLAPWRRSRLWFDVAVLATTPSAAAA